jgi:hypothetical protein
VRADRILSICRRRGIYLSQEDYVQAQCMSRREAELFIARAAKPENSSLSADKLLLTDPHMWLDEDIESASNDRGICKRLLMHVRSEFKKTLDIASKYKLEAERKEEILQYLQDDDELGMDADVEEARRIVADRHHQD